MGAGRNPKATDHQGIICSLLTSDEKPSIYPICMSYNKDHAGEIVCDDELVKVVTKVRGESECITLDSLTETKVHSQEVVCPLLPVDEIGNIKSWIADTGSSIDAINRASLSHAGKKAVSQTADFTFQTAAGPTPCNSSISLYSKALGGEIHAMVLDDSPAIFSLGKRCVDLGYGFYWPPGPNPFIIRPDGKRIDCKVVGYVPYLVEERGVACPLGEGTSSSSSSSRRVPARDDGHTQPVKDEPGEPKGPVNAEPADEVQNIVEEASDAEPEQSLDKKTLMEIEATSH